MAIPELLTFEDYSVSGLGRINVLLGKNGTGKSTVLKAFQRYVRNGGTRWGESKYITPERAGTLTYESGVEQNIINSPNWLVDTRLVNQYNQFKQQTVSQYRRLELSVLRAVETASKAGETPRIYFSHYLERINSLLDNIEIRSETTNSAFKMYDRDSDVEISAGNISSGESELIALAIEALVFVQNVGAESRGLLLMDEPDVHLHPDLQARMTQFLCDLTTEFDFDILIATHSTPILGELVDYAGANICLMKARAKSLTFEPVDDIYKQLMPVFGAHPLTRVFSNSPTLLVEGEDDVRIWQQVVRSGNGAVKLYPVECGGLPFMREYELRLSQVMESVYEGARAFSLRDRDESEDVRNDIPLVVRMQLECRAAENLLLSDEVISSLGLSWEDIQGRVAQWLTQDRVTSHPKFGEMKKFVDDGMNRKSADLKDLRMIIVGQVFASNKPWEVLVGQVIGNVVASPPPVDARGPNSLLTYLGQDVTAQLLGVAS
ncbi:AAA family ATPase [Mycobacterium sp. AZCC_0083]|uniref:ATP-dependent nuclease n=1 Tax=Mycobacterium sp. AZCC_0083 TaxID=2735882 RepID=UPI001613F1A8|nr:AAA family ATPase [Mycobacterium sp. AZCC_0083]MBB5166271.1 putative ATPase [Mycobacterium sp. AZCC_0083]